MNVGYYSLERLREAAEADCCDKDEQTEEEEPLILNAVGVSIVRDVFNASVN